MTDALMVYMTCGSGGEAERIVEALLERKLVACANILAPHTALYRWNGKVEKDQETGVIVKTGVALFEQVEEVICQMHSYECPCIVAWPVSQGHEPYMLWLAQETGAV